MPTDNIPKKIKSLILLHLLMIVYSLSGVCSKLASQESFISMKFCLCYGGIILFLCVYAIGWQQIIKKLPLTTAFSNKAVTIAWGIVWGALFFNETVSFGKIFGALTVIVGVVLNSIADEV